MFKLWTRKPSLVKRVNRYGYPSWMFNPIAFERTYGLRSFRVRLMR